MGEATIEITGKATSDIQNEDESIYTSRKSSQLVVRSPTARWESASTQSRCIEEKPVYRCEYWKACYHKLHTHRFSAFLRWRMDSCIYCRTWWEDEQLTKFGTPYGIHSITGRQCHLGLQPLQKVFQRDWIRAIQGITGIHTIAGDILILVIGKEQLGKKQFQTMTEVYWNYWTDALRERFETEQREMQMKIMNIHSRIQGSVHDYMLRDSNHIRQRLRQ